MPAGFSSRCVRFAAALAITATALPGGRAGALALPFDDTNAQGFIGLCNKAGQQVTSGSTLSMPFTWTAVSSTPAPQGYAHGKATLYAYQPRPQVDPGDWSGEQITGSSTFSNPVHPFVQSTNLDQPLVSFIGAYPPEVEGLIQLRIYYSAVEQSPYTSTYPATVIQVSGTTWHEVSGGTISCKAGTGVSNETQILGPKYTATSSGPAQIKSGGATATTAGPATGSAITTPTGRSVTTTGRGSSGTEALGAGTPASSAHKASSGLPGWAIGLIAVAGAAVIAGAAFGLRRRFRH